mmetsp:Transcript_8970/g.24862  ORF Transcript_8970/g.24862 Transcript_8970/m.24862 type:complete len:138 (+) Transcript_8970:103-516(+)|eukprot:CAMPEP_0168741144 /NCGR_PEP_ID=MMETSP0724-20121128/12354_1 /TAXON_ID=265536 /ORGANISM="Amphiprora sp., Strain CCMP467" /LENGTH=137 /DNA_ID=CAMNT_0008788623 /DNA_START=44 /DNA_END=457 /DNA_ORIENTATION=-
MGEVVALVHSHHLLDHKPDNLLLKGGKYKLRGLACLGRPGVALCIGPQVAIDNFQASLESAMPQKKFDQTPLNEGGNVARLNAIRDFEPATLGELRQCLASIGREAIFFALTGIDPSQAAASGEKAGKVGKKNKKKK